MEVIVEKKKWKSTEKKKNWDGFTMSRILSNKKTKFWWLPTRVWKGTEEGLIILELLKVLCPKIY